MEFKIKCIDGDWIYKGKPDSLSTDLAELFNKKTGRPVKGDIPVWYVFEGTTNRAREILGLGPMPELEIPRPPKPPPDPIPKPPPDSIPTPLPDSIPTPPPDPIPTMMPNPTPIPIEQLTDRQLLEQTRRTLRRMERKVNFMYEVTREWVEES